MPVAVVVIGRTSRLKSFPDPDCATKRSTQGMTRRPTTNVRATKADMILWSLRPSYRPAALKSLLHEDRSLWEHWTRDAAIFPVALHAVWQLHFACHAEKLTANWQR